MVQIYANRCSKLFLETLDTTLVILSNGISLTFILGQVDFSPVLRERPQKESIKNNTRDHFCLKPLFSGFSVFKLILNINHSAVFHHKDRVKHLILFWSNESELILLIRLESIQSFRSLTPLNRSRAQLTGSVLRMFFR